MEGIEKLITSSLIRRKKYGKSSIIVVTHIGYEPPREILDGVEERLASKYSLKRVYLKDLSPNPVAKLIELSDTNGSDIFSIICDSETLRHKGPTIMADFNIYRGTYVEASISSVFWLPIDQLKLFNQYASNFLDFRNRFIDLAKSYQKGDKAGSYLKTESFVNRKKEKEFGHRIKSLPPKKQIKNSFSIC